MKAKKNIEKLHELTKQLEVQDIWHIRNPDLERFTWRQRKPLIQCRLDYWFTSDTLQDLVESSNIIPSIRSDHSAVTLHLKNSTIQKRGQNYWKFNNTLLEDEKYNQFLHTTLTTRFYLI